MTIYRDRRADGSARQRLGGWRSCAAFLGAKTGFLFMGHWGVRPGDGGRRPRSRGLGALLYEVCFLTKSSSASSSR